VPSPAPAATPAAPAAEERATPVAAGFPEEIGEVTHFFGHVNAGIVSLTGGELHVGDTVHFRGHTTDFYQRVDRIEIDHAEVEIARPGQQAGIQVAQRVREGDKVLRVSR